MFRSKRQQEILESTESKLAKMFEEMNTEKRPEPEQPRLSLRLKKQPENKEQSDDTSRK